MIQPNELRIGNIVMLSVSNGIESIQRIGKVAQIRNDGIWLGSDGGIRFESDSLHGIPLTEEWLVKLGFDKTLSKIGTFNQIDYFDFRRSGFVCFLLSDSKDVEVEFYPKYVNIEDRQYVRTVKYVHQLQNLYFALTTMELTLGTGKQNFQ